MTIAEGSAATLRYKFYTSGTMAAAAIADRSSDPGSSGGQLLRRVSAALNLRANATGSQEILPSRQTRSNRQTRRWVEGPVSGELSPGTYFDFQEAAHRDTGTTFAAKSQTDYTSLAADNATSKLTLGGGNPVTDGLKVGDIITISGASVAGNNRHFLVLAFGGTSNREITVYPAPTDMAADTSFGLARPGLASAPPSSSHVKRKVLFERYNEDTDKSRIYEECRITGYRLNMPAEGNATFEFNVMGRNRATLSAGSAPFFAAPAAITDGNVVNTLNGAVYLGGTKIGLVTSINVTASLAADAPAVLGQAFPPDILLGTFSAQVELGFLLDDADTAASIYENETEVTVIALLTAGDFGTTDAISICLPRVKINQADEPMQGEGSQPVSCQGVALEYTGSAAGLPTTTIRIVDTAAT